MVIWLKISKERTVAIQYANIMKSSLSGTFWMMNILSVSVNPLVLFGHFLEFYFFIKMVQNFVKLLPLAMWTKMAALEINGKLISSSETFGTAPKQNFTES